MGVSLYTRSRDTHKRDANEEEIRWHFRAAGVDTRPVLGQEGEPDLKCEYEGLVFDVEVKTKGRGLSRRQRLWHAGWNGPVYIARTAEDVPRIVAAVKQHYREAVKALEAE